MALDAAATRRPLNRRVSRRLAPLQAKNRISSLRDLLHLANLPALRRLSLADPHFGPNPVCSLSNYDTFVLYHFPLVEVPQKSPLPPPPPPLP